MIVKFIAARDPFGRNGHFVIDLQYPQAKCKVEKEMVQDTFVPEIDEPAINVDPVVHLPVHIVIIGVRPGSLLR